MVKNSSVFTKDQDDYIETFFPALREQLSLNGIGNVVNTWIDETATDIFASDYFDGVRAASPVGGMDTDPATLDADGNTLRSPNEWKQDIKKKLRNHNRTKAAVEALEEYKAKTCGGGGGTASSSNPTTATVGERPSYRFFGRKPLTGRALYESEHKAELGGVRGSYQTDLRVGWDGLADKKREGYEGRAWRAVHDVGVNQTAMPRALHEELSDICQGGLMGDVEMVLLYAFRKPSGKLITGE